MTVDSNQSLPRTKAAFMQRLEASRAALEQALEQLRPEQLTGARDEQGWTVKDHLMHITAWEQSMIALFQHRPRYLGLAVDENLYSSNDVDQINAEIFRLTRGISLTETMARFHESYQQLREILAGLSDADLQKGYDAYLPEEPGHDGEPVMARLAGNTYEHYDEHLGWILSLAEQA